MIGSQYYWALHYHPVAVLGYMTVTEGYPTPPKLIERLIGSTGLPRGAFRTLMEHAELDPDHGDELDQVLDTLPLSRELEEVVGLSAMSSVDLMARCIEEVCEAADASHPSETETTPRSDDPARSDYEPYRVTSYGGQTGRQHDDLWRVAFPRIR